MVSITVVSLGGLGFWYRGLNLRFGLLNYLSLLFSLQRVLLPALARDVQPVLLSLRVLRPRQLHSSDQPSQRCQPRALELLQIHRSLLGSCDFPPSLPR